MATGSLHGWYNTMSSWFIPCGLPSRGADEPRVDLRGWRVAVVGTGASAVQIVSAVADEVAHLTVFQRSAAQVATPLQPGPTAHPCHAVTQVL